MFENVFSVYLNLASSPLGSATLNKGGVFFKKPAGSAAALGGRKALRLRTVAAVAHALTYAQ